MEFAFLAQRSRDESVKESSFSTPAWNAAPKTAPKTPTKPKPDAPPEEPGTLPPPSPWEPATEPEKCPHPGREELPFCAHSITSNLARRAD